ncbi:MAG TPA: PEP-CTERM sorting domain-containing protein [Terriglobales bacterium]|nr:PEP-CTERM sorting domain-containing protein [Terriglobales bacterium]
MKISRLCAFFLLLIVSSALAFADGIKDPKVIIKGAGGGNLAQGKCEQCIGVGFNFSFTIPESGSGNLFFTNQSGKSWNSLALFVTGVPASSISCHSQFFASCVTKTLKDGSVEILFSNGKTDNRDKGIPNGGNFQISFGCVKGTCWPGGITVTGHGSAGTLPEPATLALMTTGLGAIIARRKVRKNRFNS